MRFAPLIRLRGEGIYDIIIIIIAVMRRSWKETLE
jgi:hypothetical protein